MKRCRVGRKRSGEGKKSERGEGRRGFWISRVTLVVLVLGVVLHMAIGLLRAFARYDSFSEPEAAADLVSAVLLPLIFWTVIFTISYAFGYLAYITGRGKSTRSGQRVMTVMLVFLGVLIVIGSLNQ